MSRAFHPAPRWTLLAVLILASCAHAQVLSDIMPATPLITLSPPQDIIAPATTEPAETPDPERIAVEPAETRAEEPTAVEPEKAQTENVPLEERELVAPPAPPPTVWRTPSLPGLVESQWLAANMSRTDVKILDVRGLPAYSGGHIRGALGVDFKEFRGNVGGLPGQLQPAEMLARHLSNMGIMPSDTVIIVPGDELRDATLVGMALERLRHAKWGILNGGYGRWLAESRPTTTDLPRIYTTTYPVPSGQDAFSVDSLDVYRAVQDKRGIVLDVRPREYYLGQRTDEARAGHIPGALNHPLDQDATEQYGFPMWKSAQELAAGYERQIPSKSTPVIVHCRTGREASQAYFVLKHVLNYPTVKWYDAGWTEWAARSDLPVE